ncbi:hypothetical protein ACLOJK_006523 [Asimina triloba]
MPSSTIFSSQVQRPSEQARQTIRQDDHGKSKAAANLDQTVTDQHPQTIKQQSMASGSDPNPDGLKTHLVQHGDGVPISARTTHSAARIAAHETTAVRRQQQISPPHETIAVDQCLFLSCSAVDDSLQAPIGARSQHLPCSARRTRAEILGSNGWLSKP